MPADSEIAALVAELDSIRADMGQLAAQARHLLARVQPEHRPSAENLINYLALRRRDLRTLQPRLTALGLSSLGLGRPGLVRARSSSARVAGIEASHRQRSYRSC